MVVEKLFIAEVQKVSGSTERKICAVGITKILCEAPAMLVGDYQQFWWVLFCSDSYTVCVEAMNQSGLA